MEKTGILFLEPVFKEKIWGGDRICKDFPYPFPGDKIGECWAISAYESGDCKIHSLYDIQGKEKKNIGKTLSQVWDSHKELFGSYPSTTFPLLIKIIDAKEDLSIQVHPDDEYAFVYKPGERGKTECWLILDCEEGASIVIGHHAGTKEELTRMIEEGRWKELIREIPIRKGDFFQINPGCLHAIKGGTILLETQQSSDLTFRVYDYDRLSEGKPRQLHIKESIDCIEVPYTETDNKPEIIETPFGNRIHYIDTKYYSFYKYRIKKETEVSFDRYFTCASVIDGEGELDAIPIKKGDHFIITAHKKSCKFKGDLEIVFSNPN